MTDRLTLVHSFWHPDITRWLDERSIQWTWRTKELSPPYRTEFLIWEEEHAMAFKMCFENNGTWRPHDLE